jgi:hypothetical protein
MKGATITRVLVATEDDLGVVGSYTLRTCAIHPSQVPKEIARKLPRYDTIPTALIGRLARDLRARGRGVGELLLADAVKRVLRAQLFDGPAGNPGRREERGRLRVLQKIWLCVVPVARWPAVSSHRNCP